MRGYFGNFFRNIVEFHNHLDQITFNYKSPNIQYRVIDGNLSILGINEGGDILLKSIEEIKLDEIILDGIDNKIKEKEIKITFPELEIKDERYDYKFESLFICSFNYFVFHYIHNFEYKKGLSFFTKQQKYFYFSINLMYNIDVRNNNYYS
mgnify:CR=1 FL=1